MYHRSNLDLNPTDILRLQQHGKSSDMSQPNGFCNMFLDTALSHVWFTFVRFQHV